MAKAQNEAPGTAGSQFFVVTGQDIGLPPEYAIVGRVTDGMATVKAIDALGVGDGPPSKPVVIEKRDGRRVLMSAPSSSRPAPRRGSARRSSACSFPPCSNGSAELDQVVVVSGAYELEGAVPCPDWERGPGASLRCGLAALAPGRGGRGRRARRRA